jgi:hypothetical protein
VSDDVVPPSYHSAVSESGRPGRFHPDAAASDANPRLTPGAALIIALLLSVGLWGAVLGMALVAADAALKARGAGTGNY